MVYRPQINEKLCFVLMPFGPPFDGYYEHVIKPAVTRAGLEPLRADEIYGTRPIIQDIWQSIWKARVIIADVSGRNPNVNYELGLCHALGLPTVLLTKSIDDVPFDYRHRRCLIYDTNKAKWEANLAEDIERTIAAVIAEGQSDGALIWPYETSSHLTAVPLTGSITIERPRESILRGVAEVERMVATAYGPNGASVSVSIGNGQTVSVRRGIDIANNLRSGNPLEQNRISYVRQVAQVVQDQVGDGTKSAILIFSELLRHGHEALTAGYPLPEFLSGIDLAVSAVVSALASDAKNASRTDLVNIARTAGGDASLASMIVEAMEGAGKDGVITVGIGDQPSTKLTLLDGLRVDRGYVSDKFINSPETGQCILEDCLLLLCDRRISNLLDALPLLEQVARKAKPLLVIAEDIEGEALATLVINNLRGTIKCAAIRAPGAAGSRMELLQDIAVFSGGRVISSEVGLTVAAATIEDLGAADKVLVGKESTTIVGGRGSHEIVGEYVGQLRTQISLSSDSHSREKIQQRVANLVGRIAMIMVGGLAPPDVADQRDRAANALHAAREAVDHGWLPGAGLALLRARHAVENLAHTSDASRAGGEVVLKALERPFATLVSSAGLKPADVFAELHRKNFTVGFNAATRAVEDIESAGILDAYFGLKRSVEVASSYAKVILRTSVWNLSDPTPALPLDD